jgi:hypothetical protein
LASGPRDVSLVAYIEAAGFAHSLHAFAASRDGFDVWFKHQLLHVSGVDLNEPGETTLPELLSSYRATPPWDAVSGPIGLSW